MPIRIRKTGFKVLYILGYFAISALFFNRAFSLPTTIRTDLGLYLASVFVVAVTLFGARIFRGAGEDIAAPRAWWRMTSRPTAGFWIGSVQIAAGFVVGTEFGSGSESLLHVSLGLLFGILLGALYFASSIQLVRFRRHAQAELTPVTASRPAALLAVCAAGALVVVLLGGLAGFASTGFSTSKIASAGQYQVVTATSPMFTSAPHGFSVRFPDAPSVNTFGSGDIDVSYRNGRTDYEVIASGLEEPPSSDGLPAYYHDQLSKIILNGRITQEHSATIDGLPGERAVITGTAVPQPWDYASVVCGPNVYQLNTYGLTHADAQKFFDSFRITGDTSNVCN